MFRVVDGHAVGVDASMGPGADNPGYSVVPFLEFMHVGGLQWGRGPITPVMLAGPVEAEGGAEELQWVRGPITPVMQERTDGQDRAGQASMGPGSDNPGYGG